MHPVFSRSGRLDLYLAAWLPVAALLAAALALPARRSWGEAMALALPLTLAAAFISLAMWPLCRAGIRGTNQLTAIVASHLAAGVVSCLLWLVIGLLCAGFLDQSLGRVGALVRYRADLPLLAVVGGLLFLLATLLNYLILAFEEAREAERSALEMQIHAREAELRALRAQLNPHFLFNSLNAIGSLAGSDPGRARQMCVLLSEFLRRSMTLGVRQEIALAEELELADSYLAIEQARFGDRLRIERDIDPGAIECRVPPLVLQPLVENAVTHGIATTVDGGTLRLTVHRRAGQIEIAIENPFDPDGARRPGQGTGLENVRARLGMLHPGETRVECREAYDRFRVEVRLPATTDEARAAGSEAAAPAGAQPGPPAVIAPARAAAAPTPGAPGAIRGR
jgi:hypothetical protein